MRDFQAVIGREAKRQWRREFGGLPDVVVACVGGGSNAIGIFHAFVRDRSVRLVGVEPGGAGLDSGRHGATLVRGTPGLLHGARTMILQDDDGQILEPHSVSAGLDYPGVGPEHAHLQETGRASYVAATDEEALAAFEVLSATEGIVPAFEPSHALAFVLRARESGELPAGARVLLNLCGPRRQGSGDLLRAGPVVMSVAALRISLERGPAVSPFLMLGDPTPDLSVELARTAVQAGAGMLEIGFPTAIRRRTGRLSRRPPGGRSPGGRPPGAGSGSWRGSRRLVPAFRSTSSCTGISSTGSATNGSRTP